MDECFTLQMASSTKDAAAILLTPKCSPECRVILKGNDIITGVKVVSVMPDMLPSFTVWRCTGTSAIPWRCVIGAGSS